ncbi:MAG: hypothetical protein LQ344_000335 [Seirophora lacunosa]|nr:MAG: hypothetical protein LQ344_000335 [Seirophora lacunosa]
MLRRSPRFAPSAKAPPSSPSEQQQTQMSPFPLLKLPLELRRMVYRNILAPEGIKHHNAVYDHGEPFSHRADTPLTDPPKWRDEEKHLAAVRHDKQRADLLVLSQQIYTEASEVFWNDIHTTKVAIDSCMRLDAVVSRRGFVMPMPTYLPRIRRIEICNTYTQSGGSGSVMMDFWRKTSGHFTRLCYELATQCHALKEVVLDLSCACSVNAHGDQCPTAEGFQRLLEPLELIRVSQSIQLRSVCKNRKEHLQPVFDRVASVLMSSNPIKELEGSELVWWQLMEKGRPFLKKMDHLEHMLGMAHEFAQKPRWMMPGADYRNFGLVGFRDPYLSMRENWADRAAWWKRRFERTVAFTSSMIDEAASEEEDPLPATTASDDEHAGSRKRKFAGAQGPDVSRAKACKPDRRWNLECFKCNSMPFPERSVRAMDREHVPKGLEIDMRWVPDADLKAIVDVFSDLITSL